MPILRRALVAVAASASLAAGTLVVAQALADQPHATTPSPAYGALRTEAQDPNRQYRAMPTLQQVSWTDSAGAKHRRLIRSISVRPDGVPPVAQRMQYQDGSGRWRDAKDARTGKPLLESSDAQYAMAINVFNDSSGAVVAVESQARKDSKGRYLLRWISRDGGVSWAPGRTSIDMAGGDIVSGSSGEAFQNIVKLPDGSLLQPFYASHPAGGKNLTATHLLVGDANGAAFKRASTVFYSAKVNYNESSVVRRADGRLLMIARYETDKGGFHYSKLLSRVTTTAVNSAADVAKAKWGAAQAVKVPGAADAHGVRGVAPTLHLMSKGVLMLAFGRPGNRIAFSADGGATWSTGHDLYDNIPTRCSSGYGGNPCDALGSSGYMGVAVTSPTTAVIMGDNCQAGWGCKADYAYPHGTTDILWSVTVTLK